MTASLLLAVPAAGQAAGSWESGFDHTTDQALGAVNDFLLPFRGPNFEGPPDPPAVGSNATANFFWGQGIGLVHNRPFNAIHMALIPKGEHQGKVLVWGAWYPVRVRPNSNLEPLGRHWWCQAWSIIDPNSPAQRFRNYLLPLAPRELLPPLQPPVVGTTWEVIADLFCTGHAWSQEGDLVVAGGATTAVETKQPGLRT